MCGVKLMDKRNTVEPMDMFKLKKAADKLARANSVRWYGRLMKAMVQLVHEVDQKRKQC